MKKECSKCEYYLSFKFKKPTITEIKEYAKSIGWPDFDAENFYDKQEITGWVVRVGNTYKHIVSWKGVVRTWQRAAKRRGELQENKTSFIDKYKGQG